MKFLNLLLILGRFAAVINCESTHWMVTESGLIQPRLEAPFEMARSYDLLAFLSQETRWDSIINSHHELSKMQQSVDELWEIIERETDLAPHMAQNAFCVKAGQLSTLDYYTALLEDGSAKKIPRSQYLLTHRNFSPDTDVPDCKKISSLTFSMLAFEHLDSVVKRHKLIINRERTLPEQVSAVMTADQVGHWVAGVLRHNTSSWLHYNMAALYWRMRGNAPKAVECVRRAIHYAPRHYRDTAFLNMGTIFHRSKNTKDAIIVLGAAVDHDPNIPLNHFALANAYAVSGDFNMSIHHYERAVKLNPRLQLATNLKNGVKCHASFTRRIKIVRSTFIELVKEIRNFCQQEDDWMKDRNEFLMNMNIPEDFDLNNRDKTSVMLTELTGLDMDHLRIKSNRNRLLIHFLDGTMYNNQWTERHGIDAKDSIESLKKLMQEINNHAYLDVEVSFLYDSNLIANYKSLYNVYQYPATILRVEPEEPAPLPPPPPKKKVTTSNDDFSDIETGEMRYPTTMRVNRNIFDFDMQADWPSDRFCTDAAPKFPPNLEAIFPVFLPFENKGLRIHNLLGDKIGVPVSREHDLPWHPPNCPHSKEAAAFSLKKPSNTKSRYNVAVTQDLRQKLLQYVGNGNVDIVQNMAEAEIGHRLYAATQKKLAPTWLLYTLTALYWRVRGNHPSALQCLLDANRIVPTKYRDLVFTSLASLYLENGFFEEALATAEEAYRLNSYEPATNFVIAELNMIKKQRATHLFHLKQVVRVDPGFMNGVARNLLNGWGCILKRVASLEAGVDFGHGAFCKPIKKVCDENGENCSSEEIQCFSGKDGDASSTLARLIKEKRKDVDAHLYSADYVDESFILTMTMNKPIDRKDKISHAASFDFMRNNIEPTLQGCGHSGCRKIQLVDLSMTQEDCTFLHMQLGQWLHVVSFKEMLSDPNNRITSQIIDMSPSNQEVPACPLEPEWLEDFFVERMAFVEADDWEPILNVMQHMSEAFQVYDFLRFGAKITTYIETNPQSWWGMVAAGWWCGTTGRGPCAVRCLAAAAALAPPPLVVHPMRALVTLLHAQSKQHQAKELAYLAFYMNPKHKIEAFIVGVSHSYLSEFEQAVWMYRYSLTFDANFLPTRACLHATMCTMFFGHNADVNAG